MIKYQSMNRRDLVKNGLMMVSGLSIANVFGAQKEEKTYFNYLDVIGNQLFEGDYPPVYNTPVFLQYTKQKLSTCLHIVKATNIKTFASKNDANKFVAAMIANHCLEKYENYILDGYDYSRSGKFVINADNDSRAAALVINANTMAIVNRRGPANTIVVSPDLYDSIESVMTNSWGATGTYKNFNNVIHTNNDRTNSIELFYKGTQKWDAPLSYKVLPSGEVEVHISPAFDQSVRQLQVV